MTEQERQAIVFSAFAAIRRLVPKRFRSELEHHLAAMLIAANDQAAVYYQRGAMAVEGRADRRDLLLIEDPPELRSVH